MMWMYALLLAAAAFTLSNGFFFKKKVQQLATGDHDDNCLRLGREGDCGFYTCFNSRHDCQEYLIDHAYDLCIKLEGRKPQFTAQGQTWLTNTTKCIMKNLTPMYNSEEQNCDDLTDAGYSLYQKCALSERPNVCDIIWKNIEHFMAVTNMKSMRDARHAFSTMAQCGLQAMQRFIRYITANQINSLSESEIK